MTTRKFVLFIIGIIIIYFFLKQSENINKFPRKANTGNIHNGSKFIGYFEPLGKNKWKFSESEGREINLGRIQQDQFKFSPFEWYWVKIKNGYICDIYKTSNSKWFNFYYLQFLVKKHINKSIETFPPYTKMWVASFLLGNKEVLNEKLLVLFKLNGLQHLLVFSGFHFSIILGFILLFRNVFCRLLIKMNLEINISNLNRLLLILTIMAVFLILGFKESLLRAGGILSFYILIMQMNILWDKRMAIGIFIMTVGLLHWQWIFSLGFILSLSGAILVLYGLDNVKNYSTSIFQNLFWQYLFPTFGMMGLCSYIFEEVLLSSLIWNLIFIPIFSLFMLPLIGYSILFKTDSLLRPLTIMFENILNMQITIINNEHILLLTFFFFVIAICSFFMKIYFKYSFQLYFSCFLTILFYQNVFSNYLFNDNDNDKIFRWIQFDVGHGDAALLSFNEHLNVHMLVDTGSSYQKGGCLSLIKKLKQLNIQKLNYFQISHRDEDHNGCDSIINQIFTPQILIKRDQDITINDFRINILSNPNGSSKNNQSLISRIYYKEKPLLFLGGDIERESEGKYIKEQLQEAFPLYKSSHHGSDTSNHLNFLNFIKPLFIVTSNGQKSKGKFPGLNFSKILKENSLWSLTTKKWGDIQVYLNSKNEIIVL